MERGTDKETAAAGCGALGLMMSSLGPAATGWIALAAFAAGGAVPVFFQFRRILFSIRQTRHNIRAVRVSWRSMHTNLQLLCMFAFMGTNFNALAMDPLGHVAGTASSVLSSVQTILGGALGALIGLAYNGTILPLTLGYLVLSLLSFGVIAITEPRRLFGRADALAATRAPVGVDHP